MTRCTFALALDVDPVALVRGKGRGRDGLLEQYVNDRPYVASSFLSVAIARGLRTALGGRSGERPELAETAIDLEATVEPLPVRGSEGLIEVLFAPLGYEIKVDAGAARRDVARVGRQPLCLAQAQGHGAGCAICWRISTC